MTSDAVRPGNQREHILDEALTLMSEQGSAGMSMRQLAQACGVQVAAIYHYFPSKEALLQSVFEERQYTTRLEVLTIDAGGSAEDRLRAVFDTFWTGLLDEEPVLRLLLGEALLVLPLGRLDERGGEGFGELDPGPAGRARNRGFHAPPLPERRRIVAACSAILARDMGRCQFMDKKATGGRACFISDPGGR